MRIAGGHSAFSASTVFYLATAILTLPKGSISSLADMGAKMLVTLNGHGQSACDPGRAKRWLH